MEIGDSVAQIVEGRAWFGTVVAFRKHRRVYEANVKWNVGGCTWEPVTSLDIVDEEDAA